MSGHIVFILIFFWINAFTIHSQETDTFTLVPDWEVGLTANYELNVHYDSDEGPTGIGKGQKQSFVQMEVVNRTDEYYLVELKINPFIDLKDKASTTGDIDNYPLRLFPAILWPTERVVLKIGLDGIYYGLENVEEVTADARKHQMGVYARMKKVDSLLPSSKPNAPDNWAEKDARSYGKNIFRQFFYPMGERVLLNKAYSFPVDHKGDRNSETRAGAYIKATITDEDPQTFTYIMRIIKGMDIEKLADPLLDEDFQLDSLYAVDFSKEQLLQAMKESTHTSQLIILNEALMSGLPVSTYFDNNDSFSFGSISKEDMTKIEIKLIDWSD